MKKTCFTEIAIVMPIPGMGHLIPLAELAKRLVGNHGLNVTFIIPSLSSPSAALMSVLADLPSSITSVHLPPVNLDDLPPDDSHIETIVSEVMARSVSSIREALRSIVSSGSRLAAVVLDIFATAGIDLAREFNASPYIFFPSSAMNLSLFRHLPQLDKMVDCEYRDLDHVDIPGCLPIPGGQLIDPLQDRTRSCYKWTVLHAKAYDRADGILVNSFSGIEKAAIEALQKLTPKTYPVGPLVNADRRETKVSECRQWLDQQPGGSVLYVSFGSLGSLTREQTNELAIGLEMSGQRFLWVVRSPCEKANNSAVYQVNSEEDPLNFLPEGFLERTKSRGMVMDSWGPQVSILSHGSTGGFLSHCGWNSMLESVVCGVPVIAWPLFAEQKMNALLVTEEIGIGLRAQANSRTGMVERDEIEKVVRSLMEGEDGERLRNKANDVKNAAREAVASSTSPLSLVVSMFNNSLVQQPMASNC